MSYRRQVIASVMFLRNPVRIVAKTILGIGALLFLGIVTVVIMLVVFTNDETYDKTSDWKQYYADVVSSNFLLPADITIVSAMHTDTAIMGMRYVVLFEAPSKEIPENYLEIIAKNSGFKPSYKQGPYLWDCLRECDLWRLEYLQDKKLYQAQWGWD